MKKGVDWWRRSLKEIIDAYKVGMIQERERDRVMRKVVAKNKVRKNCDLVLNEKTCEFSLALVHYFWYLMKIDCSRQESSGIHPYCLSHNEEIN